MTEIEKAIQDFDKYYKSGYSKSELPNSYHLDLAIEALKEKAEREKGCEYCKSSTFDFQIPIFTRHECGAFLRNHDYAIYCPKCGRRLENK